MSAFNGQVNVACRKRLQIFPEYFPVYGESEFAIEIDLTTLDNIRPGKNASIKETLGNETVSSNKVLDYTGLVYSRYGNKQISLYIKDVSFGEQKIILGGILPANKCEESCTIYIFKSLLVRNPDLTLDEDKEQAFVEETQKNTDNHIELYLLGYGKIKYFNDGYYRLCNYLIQSVYDQNALEPENFDIKRFIFDSYSPSFDIVEDPISILKLADQRLAKLFDSVILPSDWTHLGHLSDIPDTKDQARENLFHFCSRYNFLKFCRKLISLPGASEAIGGLNRHGQLPCFIALKLGHIQITELMFEHLSVESNTSELIDTNKRSSDKDASFPNISDLQLKATSAAAKKIEKLCPQSAHQKPKNLKEKSQLKSLNQRGKMNDQIGNNGATSAGKLAGSTNTNAQNLSCSRVLLNSKLAHLNGLKTNKTLRQTILNNSVLPTPYGNSHSQFSGYQKHHTIVDIKHFSANLSSSIDTDGISQDTNQIDKDNDTTIQSLNSSSSCSSIDINNNDSSLGNKGFARTAFTGDDYEEEANTSHKSKSILKQTSKFDKDNHPEPTSAEPIYKAKRNSITFSFSSFLFPQPSPSGCQQPQISSTLHKSSSSKPNSMLARFKKRNLSTCSNSDVPTATNIEHQQQQQQQATLFNSTDNLAAMSDKKSQPSLLGKSSSLSKKLSKKEFVKPTIETTTTTSGSINTNTSDISNPIRKSESYKLTILQPSFNTANSEEDDSSKMKRFNYESSHESESEESAVLDNFRVNNINENLELSEDDEIDLDEMNKKNFLNSTRKTVRYEKPKATMAITKQHMRSEQNGSSSIVGMYHTHADTLQPHHHHQHASHTQNQDINIDSPVPSAVGSALLPPLPRTSPLTQSVSLAPLSAHSSNKKQQQTNQLNFVSSSLSTAKSAFNLSQDFDRNLNLRRSKRFVRQIATTGSLGMQDMGMNSILNNSINLPMKLTPTSSPVHSSQTESKPVVASRVQKLAMEESSNLKKAMSTPSIVDKIKLEDSSDNVFYDHEYDNVLKNGDIHIKIIDETNVANKSGDYCSTVNKSFSENFKSMTKRNDRKYSINDSKPKQLGQNVEKKLVKFSKRGDSLTSSTSLARSVPKAVLSFSSLGSSSAIDLENDIEPGNLIDSTNNSSSFSTTNNKDLVTINEFLKEFEMTQHTKIKPESTLSMSDLATSVATSQNTRLNSLLSSSTSTNLNSGSVSSLFSPNKNKLLASTVRSNHHSFNSTYLSLLTPPGATSGASGVLAHKLYEKPKLQQSTPLIKQISTDSILTSNPSTASKSISKSRKLGQILKLASVRGAKTKSLKQKYTNNIQQHSFTAMQTNIDLNCHVCQKSTMNKKSLHCKNCLLTVHESAPCKDQIITCLNLKPSSNSGQTQSSEKAQSSSLKQSKTKSTDRSAVNNSNGEPTASFNYAQSLKQQQFTNMRPRSMDISKLFHAHISKSTSNMYSKSISEEQDFEVIAAKTLRDSVDSLNYKFEDGCSLQSNGLFKINLDDFNKEFIRFDSEFNVNNWADLQLEEFLQTLNKQSRNKQENTFEFMKTEANYVKILAITHKIYLNVMQKDCKIEQKHLQQMFPDLDRLIALHHELLEDLMRRYQESDKKFVKSIGDILLEVFSNKCEAIVDIYSKICCSHITAKSLYKQLAITNKPFIQFLQECRKHPMLRRYQIPDCLTIITQRLTKYLTLIENMISNSKEDTSEIELLQKVLDKLRVILSRVNEAVAFHQNTADYKRILEQIDSKSFTYFIVKSGDKQQTDQRKFTKSDLLGKQDRHMISINQVAVKFMSNNGKIYKDVTCLTLNDMIVFLSLNDKSKYVFMNENSVIPCTTGVLIRPKLDEILSNRLSSMQHNSQSTMNLASTAHATSLSTHGSFSCSFDKPTVPSSSSVSTQGLAIGSTTGTGSGNQSCGTSCTNFHSNSSYNLSYIVNTITNEIVELKFPDEFSRNHWASLVHTHITPFLVAQQAASLLNEESNGSTSTLRHQSSNASNSSQYSEKTQQQVIKSSSNANTSVPLLTANTYRCNSNISTSSSNSSGHGSSFSTSSNSTKLTSNGLEAALKNINDSEFTSSSDMQLSPDIANILYSFNTLIEQQIFQSNLMRSASSAGETVTKNTQDPHTSVPKRAETFNGASSSKEANLNINANILQSYFQKMSGISDSAKETKINKANSNVSDTTNGLALRSNANSDVSADFGYHSRLCVDLNHDIDGENCSCSYEGNNQSSNTSTGGKKGSKAGTSNGANNSNDNKESRRSTTSITKGQFEGILKTILNDYVRIKNENEVLRKELEARGGSPVDILKHLVIPEPEKPVQTTQQSQKRCIEVEHMQADLKGKEVTIDSKWSKNTIKF